MPVDYSKWDNLELSDDEDFECHPNVDKSSMIRWKQAQIHKERRERQDQRDLLKMEYETTKNYLEFMPARVETLKSLPPTWIPSALMKLAEEIDKTCTDPMRKASMAKMENWPGNWDTPVWGDVLRNHKPWNEEINNIMKAAEEYITKGTDLEKTGEVIGKLFQESFERFKTRQPIIAAELKRIEDLMNKKLTMDHLVTGFDKTFVEKKPKEEHVAPAADKSFDKSTGNKTIETIHTPKEDPYMNQIFNEMESTDQHLLEKHPLLLQLSEKSDYGEVYKILKGHPDISTEANEEALLLRALCFSVVGKLPKSKVAVQNAMILKFTRSLGANGVDVFFSKLQGTGSSAQNLFFSDIQNTLDHITRRGGVLRKERIDAKKQLEAAEAKKQEIYKSFLQPDGTLKLPLGENPTPTDLKQKEWFDNLPEDYKRKLFFNSEGLLLEDVDKINAYLSSLSPEEADFQANIAAKSGFIRLEEEEEVEESKAS